MHRANLRFTAVALVLCLAGSGAIAAEAALPANLVAPTIVPQTGSDSDVVAAIVPRITMPLGFRITRFALVPGARDLAVAPDGSKVFVGTMGEQVYVLDLATRTGRFCRSRPSHRRSPSVWHTASASRRTVRCSSPSKTACWRFRMPHAMRIARRSRRRWSSRRAG